MRVIDFLENHRFSSKTNYVHYRKLKVDKTTNEYFSVQCSFSNNLQVFIESGHK